MLSLIGLTLATSFVDSLNPFAIAQQFTLQGLLKKASDIWYYIITIFTVNFVAGLLFYSSMSALSEHLFAQYWTILETPIAILALIASLVLIWYSIHSLLRSWKARKIFAHKTDEMTVELEAEYAKKTLSPSALVSIALTTSLIEFSTAAPFVAYLTIVYQYQPSLWVFLAFLFLYVFIFTLPLIVLYFLYIGFQSAFERIYKRLNVLLQIVEAVLLPALFIMIALVLLGFSITTIFL